MSHPQINPSRSFPTLPDLDLESPAALRASFPDWSRSGAGVWLRLTGLPIDDAKSHGSLYTALERLGMNSLAPTSLPRTLVLDWTGADNCSAEGMALFAVLATRFVRQEVRVIVVEPDFSDVRDALKQSQLYDRCEAVEWVRVETSKRSVLRSCARAAVFSGSANDSVDDFCDDLSDALETLSVPKLVAQAAMGTTFELLQNTLSHAGGCHAAALGLVLPRRRPPVLQIGIADDGIGIPNAVAGHPRYGLLSWLSDATITTAVIREHLSGRTKLGATDEGGGGGMARIIKKLLAETPAEVTVRSGKALVSLRSESPEDYSIHRLTYGAGTQVRIQLRLA